MSHPPLTLSATGLGWRRWALILMLSCPLEGRLSAEQVSDPAARVSWRTGTDLQRHLQESASVQWSEAELRPRLMHLAATHRVAVFLDRRLDPNQKVDLAATGVTFEALLDQLGRKVGGQPVRVGAVIYLGPPQAAGALAAIAPQRRKDLQRHPALSRSRPQPWIWGELSEPRQLLLELARQHQLTVANPEVVPHDLWPAADLPPLDLADRLTLLLAGFDLTFEVSPDGRQIQLGPLPTNLQYDRSYTFAGDATQAIAALKRDFPEITLRRNGRQLIVQGTAADHERVARLLAGDAPVPTQKVDDNTRFTLTVANESAGAVVGTIARRLDRQLKLTAKVRQQLAAKVNLSVKDVTLDELMQQVLDPLGLTYRLSQDVIEVLEKNP